MAETVRIPKVKEGVCPLSTREITDRVLQFTETVNKRILYAYQVVFARRIIESLLLRDGETITALFARQSGKSEVVACLALALCLIMPALHYAFPNDERFTAYKEGFRVGVFGPTNKHSGIVYFRMRSRVESEYFVSILFDPELNLRIAHSRGDSFAFTNGSIVEAFPASPNVLNEGGTYHLMIIDEAQRIEGNKINKELRPMLSHFNGSMVQIGTAFMSRCQFRRDIKANIEKHRTGGRRNHFEFNSDQVVKDRQAVYKRTGDTQHLAYEKWLRTELARIGGNVEDESWKMNFRLLWQESFAQALDMVRFKNAGLTHIEANMPWEGLPYPGGRIVAGLDVARDGDATWLTVMQEDTRNPILEAVIPEEVDDSGVKLEQPGVYYDKAVIGWLRLNGSFEGDYGQYQRIVTFLLRFPRPEVIAVDATGIGDAVWERISVLMPGVTVIPFRYSTPSKHNLFRWYFQELGADRFHYAAGPVTQESPEYQEFIRQHEGLVREYQGNYLHVAAGNEDDHDDAPNSAALAAWAAKHQGMQTVDLNDQGNVIEVEVSSQNSNYRSPAHVGRAGRYTSRR